MLILYISVIYMAWRGVSFYLVWWVCPEPLKQIILTIPTLSLLCINTSWGIRGVKYDLMYNSFNEKSLRVINNIYNNLLSHPLFSNCQIERINDFGNGTVQLDMYLNGNFYNKYMFCPDPAGNIESVAIYGASLMEHLRKIEASMKFCDIDVLEVSIDNGGYSPYVDVILGTY